MTKTTWNELTFDADPLHLAMLDHIALLEKRIDLMSAQQQAYYNIQRDYARMTTERDEAQKLVGDMRTEFANMMRRKDAAVEEAGVLAARAQESEARYAGLARAAEPLRAVAVAAAEWVDAKWVSDGVSKAHIGRVNNAEYELASAVVAARAAGAL